MSKKNKVPKDGQGFARRVTLENIADYAPLFRKKSDAGSSESGDEGNSQENLDPEFVAAEGLFVGKSIKINLPFKRKKSPQQFHKKKQAKKQTTTQKPPTQKAQGVPAARGAVVWRKTLEASDCQRQPGHGTGGMRLTQAGFKVNGKLIDPTTYFRNDLFAGFQWKEKTRKKFAERAPVQFHITIRGKDYGIRTLDIAHKPSGEAGQHNQTTDLKWTGMTKEIEKLNLTGRELVVYGPAPGTTQPFFIEIT